MSTNVLIILLGDSNTITEQGSDFKNSNWVPSEEDNLGAVSESYYSIKKELNILQDKVNCPDNFIYDFLGAIQKEWDPESCQSKAKKFKKKYI